MDSNTLTTWASPEAGDVVEVDGMRGIIRAVHPDGHVKVATHGDHDEGVWILPTTLRVVYREGSTPDESRRRVTHPARSDYRSGRVQTLVKAAPEVMACALRLAHGDARRLQVNRDGSVYVR